MTRDKLKDALNAKTDEKFAQFVKVFGGENKGREAVVRGYVDHPEWERRLSHILGLQTQDEKRTTATIDAARASKRSATVAAISTLIAAVSLAVGWHYLRVGERAWVVVESAQLADPLAIGQRPKVVLRIANSGRTPAIETAVASVVFSRAVLSSDDLADETIGNRTSNAVLAPGTSFTIWSTSSEPFSRQQQIDAIRKGPNRLYVMGTIYYLDVFKKSHQTRFCFRTGDGSLNNMSLAACADHNDVE